MQYFWSPPHGIPSGIPLKNNTTLLEAMRTNTQDGPHCVRKGTRQYHISPIFSIPCAPNWVSKTLNDIWCSNTAVVLHRYIQTQHKKGNEKLKKDTGKWCEYHKIPWHNTKECHSKKSLVVELKASEPEAHFDFESNPEGGKWIIDAEPSAIITITKF
jgi:hypothetical protein